MSESIKERLSQTLDHMKKHPVDAYWIPSVDEHLNEYVPSYKQRRQWISGFTGSAGIVVLCRTGKHQIFVDSRYHIQADEEVDTTLFDVHKLGSPGALSPEKWIQQQVDHNPKWTLGMDPFLTTPQSRKRYQRKLQQAIHWISPNLVDLVWTEQPAPPANPIYALSEKYSGQSVSSKLEQLRLIMQEHEAQMLILTKLDEIAWLLNLRGSDIEHNPVFEAYLVIGMKNIDGFHLGDLEEEAFAATKSFVQWHPYDEYTATLSSLLSKHPEKVWVDPSGTTMGTYEIIKSAKLSNPPLEQESPLTLMKALKNEVELQQMMRVHRHAACGKIRSFIRLDKALKNQEPVSEKLYTEWLYEEYAKEPGFTDLSFGTIAGFAENGAIVHYGNPSSQKMLLPNHLFLVDSGIQALGGTTDDTRTLMIGEPDAKHKKYYTLVLQAHIRLACQRFPRGTKGAALDAVTRSGLWNAGVDYGHGTGHGVGAFLNVHEGPQGISPMSHRVALEPGMVLSNEPGYYEAQWGGIRLENLYVVVEDHESWLRFEPLTLIPFEAKLVEWNLLSSEECDWLSTYHQKVQNVIGPMLSKENQQWLNTVCQAFQQQTN